MKQYHRDSLLVALFSTILLIGCSGGKDKIASLIEQRQFNEARSRLDELTPEQKAKPEMLLLVARVDFGLLTDSVHSIISRNEFDSATKLLLENAPRFSAHQAVVDSLNNYARTIALEGARYYLDSGEYYKAYVCAARADKLAPLSGDGLELLNGARKRMLSGVWIGAADKGKRKVTIKLNALTNSTFEGTAYFENADYQSDVTGGFFDGEELSATLVSHYRIPIERYDYGIRMRKVVGWQPASTNFTMTGSLADGLLKISLPSGKSVSHWTLHKESPATK
jgi:hypothetical protein